MNIDSMSLNNPLSKDEPLEKNHSSNNDTVPMDKFHQNSSSKPTLETHLDSVCYDRSVDNTIRTECKNYVKNRNKEYTKTTKRWAEELFAYISSLIVLLFTILFLKKIDGKAQPEWPYGITLNSVLSWLSTAFKGFLLIPVAECISQLVWVGYSKRTQSLDNIGRYDAASRGLWGSLRLLWTSKARDLASLGAVLTILAAALDPTMQQLLVVRTRVLDQKGKAFIPRAQTFLRCGQAQTEPGWPRNPASDMIGAMYAGLFNEQGNSSNSAGNLDVSPTCPTGNCTFPAFKSLSICNRCQNMTDMVHKECSLYNGVSPRFGMLRNVTACRFSLSQGFGQNLEIATIDQLLPGPNSIDIPDKYSSDITDEYTSLYRRTIACESPSGSNDSSIAEFARVVTVIGETKPNNSMSVEATLCTMSWCVNQYQASIVDGKFSERITASEQPREVDYVGPGSHYMFQDSQGHNFTIAWEAWMGLTDWLDRLFRFTNTWKMNITNISMEPPDKLLSEQSFDKNGMIDLFLLEDTKNIMSRLARAMTTYIRSRSNNEQIHSTCPGILTANETSFAGPLEGLAHTLEVYVAVRWAWLALLVALLVATWVFLTIVIVGSMRQDVAVWKSSPFALLYHGLDEGIIKDLKHVMELKDMERTAKVFRVRLKNSGLELALD